MKTSIACAIAVAVMPALFAGTQNPGTAGRDSLFDGKTFNGWEGNLASFRIEAGAIVGGTLAAKIPRNEFLCTTREFKDFELRLKVKLLGGDQANAGVQFRTARIPNDHEVIGFQADMGTGWWGALYDESRRKKVLQGPDQTKMKDVIKQGDWNDYVIRADGPRVQLSINGFSTVDYTETDSTVADSGVICVQIHSGPPSEAWYRDITIVELKQRAQDTTIDKRSQPIIDVHRHASWPGADDAAERNALLAEMDAQGIVLIDAGFGDRIMFGSDTRPAGPILRRLESIDWLTAPQRRAILYDNAARFLRLDQQTIARHHGR